MAAPLPPVFRALLAGVALSTLAACNDQPLDWDLRQSPNTPSTSEAARTAVADRPAPDGRGVISYPTYQVAVAERGDTVAGMAARIGLPAVDLAKYNGMTPVTGLRQGEILALPRRVAETAGGLPGASTVTGGSISSGPIDITTLANGAIERAGTTLPAANKPQGTPGREPVRHQVLRGETAFTIARLYNVPAKALADWNGLGPDLVRIGQLPARAVRGRVRPEVAEIELGPSEVGGPGEGGSVGGQLGQECV